MTDFRLRLIVDTLLKDEQVLKSLKKDLEGLDAAGKKGDKGLTSVKGSLGSLKSGLMATTGAVVAFGAAAKAAEDVDDHWKVCHPFAEGQKMLLRKHGGRDQHRDLPALKRHLVGGADRKLGFAVADVAADQPVHRAG